MIDNVKQLRGLAGLLMGLSAAMLTVLGDIHAYGQEHGAPRVVNRPTKQASAPLDGISRLLLVRGKSRAEALKLALTSGAKEVVVNLQNVGTKKDSDSPGPVSYHVTNGRVARTELVVFRSRGQKFIKDIYDRIIAVGKIDQAKSTKQRTFLTIPVDNKRALSVEMQKPSTDSEYPWRVCFRPDGVVGKPASRHAPSGTAKGSDAGHSKMIAGVRVPLSVSSSQVAAFIKPQWKSVRAIELLDVPILFGQGKLVQIERLVYVIAAGKGGEWGVRSGTLGRLECWIREKNQDYQTLMGFVADLRSRGQVTLSRDSFFLADVTMPTTGIKGEISVSFSISDPEYRAMMEKMGRELLAKIVVSVGPADKGNSKSETKPARVKSKK